MTHLPAHLQCLGGREDYPKSKGLGKESPLKSLLFGIIQRKLIFGMFHVIMDKFFYFRKNEIKNNGCGLLLYHSHYNNISLNRVLQNSYGMWLGDYSSPTEFSNNNDIVRNLIENNKRGIYVFLSHNCSIHGNNFYDNDKDAFQQRLSSSSWNVNNWNGNFWGRPRLLPKLIPSYIGFFGFTFDWHPALTPYDIQS